MATATTIYDMMTPNQMAAWIAGQACGVCFGNEGDTLGPLKPICKCKEFIVHAACSVYTVERQNARCLNCKSKRKPAKYSRPAPPFSKVFRYFLLLTACPSLAPYYKTVCRSYFCNHFVSGVFAVAFLVFPVLLQILVISHSVSMETLQSNPWVAYMTPFLLGLALASWLLDWFKPAYYLSYKAAACTFAD